MGPMGVGWPCAMRQLLPRGFSHCGLLRPGTDLCHEGVACFGETCGGAVLKKTLGGFQ